MIQIVFYDKALNTECTVHAVDEYSSFSVVSSLLKSGAAVKMPTTNGKPVSYKWALSFDARGIFAY